MKTFKLFLISLVSLGLMMVGPAKAAHIADVTASAYQYVNTDSTFTSTGDPISEAYLWSGDNISGDGADLIANLTNFLTDHGIAPSFSFTSAAKVDVEGDFTSGFFNTEVLGVLLKASTETLFVAYSELTGPLFWNTLFSLNNQGDPKALSHYVLFDGGVGVIPIPAALWLFAPALLGLLGIRRKYST
jgi:hypothetical protein